MRLPVYKLQLVRERWETYPPISTEHPQLAALFFHRLIGQAAVEHSAALFLDPKGRPTGSTIIAMGTLSRVSMVGREMFKASILANASALVASHNHPSGSSKPSLQDVRVTELLIEAGNILGIKVLDHIIVTPSTEDFTSMVEAGLMPGARSTAANS